MRICFTDDDAYLSLISFLDAWCKHPSYPPFPHAVLECHIMVITRCLSSLSSSNNNHKKIECRAKRRRKEWVKSPSSEGTRILVTQNMVRKRTFPVSWAIIVYTIRNINHIFIAVRETAKRGIVLKVGCHKLDHIRCLLKPFFGLMKHYTQQNRMTKTHLTFN